MFYRKTWCWLSLHVSCNYISNGISNHNNNQWSARCEWARTTKRTGPDYLSANANTHQITSINALEFLHTNHCVVLQYHCAGHVRYHIEILLIMHRIKTTSRQGTAKAKASRKSHESCLLPILINSASASSLFVYCFQIFTLIYLKLKTLLE